MTSCSDDDSTTTDPVNNDVFVTKVVDNEAGEILTFNYTYEGNKIIKNTFNDGSYEDYSYNSDNKVTGISYYNEGGTLSEQTNFLYTSGQLTSIVSLDQDIGIGAKKTFTHNTDGTIDYEEYTGDLNTQTVLQATGVITITNGNLTEDVSYDGGVVSEATTETWTYTFDNKNNPFKNIASFNEIMLYENEETGYVNTNNVTSLSIDYGTETDNYTVVNTYNSQDYPTVSVETDDNDITSIDTKTYTYN
ncbi:MAG: hypothetical protein BM557_05045 [Flavobacterium sp. MedPE-SWcel]|nr:MAG: hypothetical protein BM557_05045 [Flavobacterium sp. MedPE-SWcel]